jgi:hypothetical protein
MIEFHANALWFQTPEGETVPRSVETVALELCDEAGSNLDPEVVAHAAQAVLHYFKEDLARNQVSVGEFAQTLATVLRALGLPLEPSAPAAAPSRPPETDLRRLACEAGDGFELGFFSRLRSEFRQTLARSPQLVRFRGLRGCVKQLARAQRWNPRCQRINDQIVDYLRSCLSAEGGARSCSLIVL